MSEIQYRLQVKNGDTIDESGYFFKPAPFTIETPNNSTTVVFTRNNAYEVIYRLTCAGKQRELSHPDYTPDDMKPDALGEHTDVFAALVRLGITTHPDYNAFFGSYAGNFTVTQPLFLKPR